MCNQTKETWYEKLDSLNWFPLLSYHVIESENYETVLLKNNNNKQTHLLIIHVDYLPFLKTTKVTVHVSHYFFLKKLILNFAKYVKAWIFSPQSCTLPAEYFLEISLQFYAMWRRNYSSSTFLNKLVVPAVFEMQLPL